jgi:hypothetical protein
VSILKKTYLAKHYQIPIRLVTKIKKEPLPVALAMYGA